MIVIYCKYCRHKTGCIKHENIKHCDSCSKEECRLEDDKEKQYVGWCELCSVIGAC